jgi:hypothetical protein
MLLKTFKSNRAVNYFLFPIAGLLLWGRSLISSRTYPFFQDETANLLYIPVRFFTGYFPWMPGLLALTVVLVMAFLVMYINNRYSILQQRTMLSFLLFVLLVSGVPWMQVMHPVYPGALFFLLAIFRLFSAFDRIKSYSAAFDAGFFLGMGSLFYFNLFVLLPAFIVGIGILAREPRWREFLLVVTGFLLPFVFALSYAYLSDQFLEFLKVLERGVVTPNDHFKDHPLLQLFTGYLTLLTLLGSVKILQQYDSLKVSTRRYYIVFFLLFISSLAGILLIPAVSLEMVVIAAIPVTFLMANFFLTMKKRFWGEFWFILLLSLVIVMQFLT